MQLIRVHCVSVGCASRCVARDGPRATRQREERAMASEGDACTFVCGGGAPEGETFNGACSSGVCGAGTEPAGQNNGQNKGRVSITCPALGETAYTGTEAYKGGGKAAPSRGPVGCVDQGPLARRPRGAPATTCSLRLQHLWSDGDGFSKLSLAQVSQQGTACLILNFPAESIRTLPRLSCLRLAMTAGTERWAFYSITAADIPNPFHYHEHELPVQCRPFDRSLHTHRHSCRRERHLRPQRCRRVRTTDLIGAAAGLESRQIQMEKGILLRRVRAPFALACFGR